jgi:hypothetical protein
MVTAVKTSNPHHKPDFPVANVSSPTHLMVCLLLQILYFTHYCLSKCSVSVQSIGPNLKVPTGTMFDTVELRTIFHVQYVGML